MNQAAAQYQTETLQDAAIQIELYDVLAASGPLFVHRLCSETGRPASEIRWHLREMQKRGEIKFRAGWGYGV